MKNPKVSIIYVNFKSERDLIESICSVIESKPKLKYEIIVIDNSPKDTVSKKLKKISKEIIYLKNIKNTGYGAGNNLGATFASGEYLFILNPDTKVYKKTVEILSRFLDKNEKAGMVAPNLFTETREVFEDIGSLTLTPVRAIFSLTLVKKIFPQNRFSKEYELRDISKDSLREVDVLPGSALMIKKEIFEQIGKFDENMFMFFEEADLGKRVSDAGYKIFIEPKAKVVHKWRGRKSKSFRLQAYFKKSRFYYFKKHYGNLSAIMVEIFARASFKNILLASLLVIGFLLRAYRLEERMVFGAELGHNYLAVKNFITQRQIPLLGPPTSHPWLAFGPLFYWLIAPVLVAGKFDPVFVSYFFAIIFTLTIFLNYQTVKNIFSQKIALISSFLIAISPTWLLVTRGSRFFSLSILCFYPFYYYLYKSLNKNPKYLFWAGFFYGLMLNFHLSGIILFPAILFWLLIKRKKVTKQACLLGLVGLAFANIPFLLHNLFNKFEMLVKLLIWVPYRIAGFLGIYQKNTVNPGILRANLASFYNFVTAMFVDDLNFLKIPVFLLFMADLAYLIKSRSFKRNVSTSLLLSFLLLGYVAIFFHGNPPKHYFLPLYPVVIIIVSYFIEFLFKSKKFKNYGKAFLVFLVGASLLFLRNNRWFSQDNYLESEEIPSYQEKIQITKFIVADSGGRPYSLKRVGLNDDFEGDFAQDYQYLMWLNGNEPVLVGNTVVNLEKEPQIGYTIYENGIREDVKTEDELYQIDGVDIIKEKIK